MKQCTYSEMCLRRLPFCCLCSKKLEGPGGLHLGFAGMTALAWVMIYFIVIETKMKTLEEIEAIVDAAEGI